MIFARQLSRPVADLVMRYGKDHPIFRNKILIPVGKNIVHFTTRLRMKNLGLGAPTTLAPVSEASALEQASDFIQQVVIFSYSVGVFAAYYYYTKANEKESPNFAHLGQIKDDVDAKFFELNRRLDLIEKQLKYAVEPRGLLSSIMPRSHPQIIEQEPEPSLPRKTTLSSLPFEEAASKIITK
uniref:OPA3-like protein n=1 Tax=Panagrolaimus sp. ES5 TaxID=591445 RepID=A0AC34FTH3_9BILA